MSEFVENKFDRSQFKLAAELKTDDVLELLRTEMSFTEIGLQDMFKTKHEPCVKFFSELIGDDALDIEDEDTRLKILQKGVSTPDVIADVMYFIYTHFAEKQVDSVEKTPKLEEKTKVVKMKQGAPERAGKIDWAALPVPFKEDTAQYFVFTQALKHKGTLQELLGVLDILASEGRFTTKNVGNLLNSVFTDAKKRGWIVITKPTVKLTKVSNEAAH